jgi:hypothetical protein
MATKNIYQKLLLIQQSINGLGKDKQAFGYKYVTGDKVLENIKPLMNEHGLLLKQEVISIENTRQDYKTKSGETSEINSKVMMKFTWIDADSGEKEECLFGANGQNAWDKGVGSALTYGERYFLLKFFHIATDEDDIDNPDRKENDLTAKMERHIDNTAKPQLLSAEQSEKLTTLLSHESFSAEYKKKMMGKIDTYTPVMADKMIGILDDEITKWKVNNNRQ